MEKVLEKKIKKLKENGDYQRIFDQFGQKVFLKHVPKKYKKMDIKRLQKEGRYEDIFWKYGEKVYNRILFNAMYKEIKENKGNREANTWKIKTRMQKFLKALGFTTVFGLLIATGGKNNENFQNTSTEISSTIDDELKNKNQDDLNELMDADNNSISKDNLFMRFMSLPRGLVIEYYLICIAQDIFNKAQLLTCKKEIDEYLDQVEKYGKRVKRMNLSNIQLFMKVMEDMWKNIQGYKSPKLFKEKNAMMDLVLATDDKSGVCRNMAPYVARRLNAINPEFNARVAVVYYSIFVKGYKKAKMKRKLIKDSFEGLGERTIDSIKKRTGNHVIVLVDSKEDNAIIALDPTNPGIGVLIEGRIYMFNEKKYRKSTYVLKEIATTVQANQQKTNLGFSKLDGINDYNNSWEPWANKNYDRLRRKYSVSKQNEALMQLRHMEEGINIRIEDKPNDMSSLQNRGKG